MNFRLQRFTGEVKVIDGLEGYRFTFPENSLDNGEVNTENKCFCRKGKCLPAGLIDVHDCYYGEWKPFALHSGFLRVWTYSSTVSYARKNRALLFLGIT